VEHAPAVPALTEEEQIGSAKYLPRDLPPRLFEEERFLFPESYGQDRVRLLVKDPEWIFAYWDVNPESVAALRSELGERVTSLSRLTLRLTHPDSDRTTVVLLPEGARSWYVRAERPSAAYRAELGFTLPSGEFRSLARSNETATPRVGPSSEKATRRARYGKLHEKAAQAALSETAQQAAAAPAGAEAEAPSVPAVTYFGADFGPGAAAKPATGGEAPQRGGASDAFRPASAGEGVPRGGASDVHRR
jgi:hypothetical protein